MTDEASKPAKAILTLLAARPADTTICPSEAARIVDAGAWRDAIPRVHAAARALAARGAVVLTQAGHIVGPDGIVGPYRIAAVARAQEVAPAPAKAASPGGAPFSSPRE